MIFRAKETFIKPVLPLELCSLFGLAVYVNVNTSKRIIVSLAGRWDEVTVTLDIVTNNQDNFLDTFVNCSIY